MAAAIGYEQGVAERLGARLLSMTSLVPPAANDPFAASGTLAAGIVKPRRRIEVGGRFDAAEARSRISDFVGGGYAPGSLSELMGYLASRFLRLEARRGANGQWINYLVDLRTKGAMLAAEVDRRLSTLGIASLRGWPRAAAAAATRRRLQTTPEMMDARVLRNELSSLFHRQGLVPDDDWESFDVTVNTTFGGRVAMVQGRELWVGREVARAGDDPAENLKLLRRLQAEGRACLWPAANVDDARAGRLVRGMPIILREGAVRTRMIDPERLSLESLTRKFGETYLDYYARKPRQPGSLDRSLGDNSANVVPMSLFRKRPAAPMPRQEALPAARQAAPASRQAVEAASRSSDRFAIRHEPDGRGGERLLVRDRWEGGMRHLGDTDLSAGRYVKEDGFGLPSGSLQIDVDGGYSHRDEEGRLHNTLGPAIVPAQGNPVYAIEGEILTDREFHGRPGGRSDSPVSRRLPLGAMRVRPQAQASERYEDSRDREDVGMRAPAPAARPGR